MFNAQQQAVIGIAGGHHLVLAPPGCGKTAVLAERIAEAHRRGVSFNTMACLTFTNRAARGMRERIAATLGPDCNADELFVGNVHRFCSQFLFGSHLVPEHTLVADTDLSMSIIADYLNEDDTRLRTDNRMRQSYSQIINLQHLMHQCEHRYPRELIVHRDALNGSGLKELCLAFEMPYSQDSAIEIYRHADHYYSSSTPLGPLARQTMTALYVARCYENYKRSNDLIDFGDLLLLAYEAMTADKAHQFKRFAWVQIDEVQDLSALQLAIIDLFTEPDATVVYLGDPQQAIFSFMGAQTETLNLLFERCGKDHLHNFFRNYRSPKYLLDMLAHYAAELLHIAPDLLPTTTDTDTDAAGRMQLMCAPTLYEEAGMVADHVRWLCATYPRNTVAVVVAYNSDADLVSRALGTYPHFKISGQDFFDSPPMRLLLAHLSVVSSDDSLMAWASLLYGVKVYASNSSARKAVHALRGLALTPADFLRYERSSAVIEFARPWQEEPFVVFDTETTGLDVWADDVVQIAAVRVEHGKVTASLNLFLETTKALPERLGDVVNPLIEEYARQPHTARREAFECFVDFARGCQLIGHNTTFDWQIIEHNMERDAPHLDMEQLWPHYHDTLKLSRRLFPRLKSYKLKMLLAELGLEGENSHLADDDILATLHLANRCYEAACKVVPDQLEYIVKHQKSIEKLRNRYLDLWQRTRQTLWNRTEGCAISHAVSYAYAYLKDLGCMEELPKLRYFLAYIEQEMVTSASGTTLAAQLSRHLPELCTLHEADLCGSKSMTEQVVVSTIHKAKGLEFDSVIVFDATARKFPSCMATPNEGGEEEERRKFYVALSRARRRLYISWCQEAQTPWGGRKACNPSPYLKVIKDYFER